MSLIVSAQRTLGSQTVDASATATRTKQAAGNRRLASPPQNDANAMWPCALACPISDLVIRNPETTKNTCTPPETRPSQM